MTLMYDMGEIRSHLFNPRLSSNDLVWWSFLGSLGFDRFYSEFPEELPQHIFDYVMNHLSKMDFERWIYPDFNWNVLNKNVLLFNCMSFQNAKGIADDDVFTSPYMRNIKKVRFNWTNFGDTLTERCTQTLLNNPHLHLKHLIISECDIVNSEWSTLFCSSALNEVEQIDVYLTHEQMLEVYYHANNNVGFVPNNGAEIDGIEGIEGLDFIADLLRQAEECGLDTNKIKVHRFP